MTSTINTVQILENGNLQLSFTISHPIEGSDPKLITGSKEIPIQKLMMNLVSLSMDSVQILGTGNLEITFTCDGVQTVKEITPDEVKSMTIGLS